MLPAWSSRGPAPARVWRGVIVTIACAAYMLIIFDFSRSPTSNERLAFMFALLGGIGGMALYFYDFSRWYRSNRTEPRDKADGS